MLARPQNRRVADRQFPRVLAAEGISNFGSMLSRLAIPWLAVLSLQATPLQMAWLGMADVAAAGLGALLLGGWVDRHGKRAVMLVCDGLRCALLLALAICAWRGWASLPLLLLAAAASGLLSLAFELARSAWMAQRLAAAELPQRNAQLSMVASLSETAAFALGGWLYQGLGAVLALGLDAASYLASALCLRGVAEAPPAVAEPDPAPDLEPVAQPIRQPPLAMLQALAQEATAGLQVVAANPALRRLAGVELLRACSQGLVGTVILIFINRELAVPTGQQGLIFATGALGALLGAAVAPRWGRQLGAGRAMALGLCAFALGTACVPLAGPAVWAWAPAVVVAWLVLQQLLGDAGHTLYEVHDRSLRQTAVPPDRLARADAGLRCLALAGTLAGMLAGGLLGECLGAAWVLWLGVAAAAAAALLAALTLAQHR